MSIRRTLLLVFVTIATLAQALAADSAVQAANPSNQGEARPAPERLAADTARVTPGGAAFTAPAGWSITSGKNIVILEPPETDTHIVIVDCQAADAATAVAAAWTAYKPDFKRPLRLATPRPAREGWEERQAFSYETSPNERAVVAAIRATLPYSARNAIMGSTRSHRR